MLSSPSSVATVDVPLSALLLGAPRRPPPPPPRPPPPPPPDGPYVSLFENLLESAADAAEVKGELHADLATRCRAMYASMGALSEGLDDSADLSRAVVFADRLRAALHVHDEAVGHGRLTSLAAARAASGGGGGG